MVYRVANSAIRGMYVSGNVQAPLDASARAASPAKGMAKPDTLYSKSRKRPEARLCAEHQPWCEAQVIRHKV